MRASTTLWGGGSLSLGLEGDKGKKKDTKTVHSSEAWRSRNEAKREERKREGEGVGWMDRFEEKERKKNGAGGGGGARRSEVCQITEVRDINDS